MPPMTHDSWWRIARQAVGRLARVDGHPVLSVKATYPRLTPLDGANCTTDNAPMGTQHNIPTSTSRYMRPNTLTVMPSNTLTVMSAEISAVTLPEIGRSEHGKGMDAAIARFNDTYRRAAEAFLAWGLDVPATEATAARVAMGQGGAYRFARWELMYEAVPTWEAETATLRVRTVARWQVRRETSPRRQTEREDIWSWPSLWLMSTLPPRRSRGRAAVRLH